MVMGMMDEFHSSHLNSHKRFLNPQPFIHQGQFFETPFSSPNENLVQSPKSSLNPQTFTFQDQFVDIPFSSPNENLVQSPKKSVNPHTFIHQDQFLDIPLVSPIGNLVQPTNSSSEGISSHDGSEIFSDTSLNYISQMLMDETDRIDNFQEYFTALEATEKPFYEILGENCLPPMYPPKPEASNSLDGSCGSASNSGVVDNNWPYDYSESQLPLEFTSQSSFGAPNGLGLSSVFLQSLPEWHFNKGVEEARKFLPRDDKLAFNLEASDFSSPLETKEESKLVEVILEKEERGRKNPYRDDLDSEEGRSVKQSAVSSSEDSVRSKMFDDVLLCHGGKFSKTLNDIRETLQHVTIKSSQNGHGKGSSNVGKGRGRKQTKKELVDLRALLIQCAQMAATGDQRSTKGLMNQIAQHSSPNGDGTQRLAHYFANGLEARLAGTGSEIYSTFDFLKRSYAADFLKAYRLYLAACPFKKISHLFSNQTILNVSEKAKTVHIVDFGINFGFQWPSLIQRITARPGGPPKLRITGIDFPQPGFRPSERIEETGRRLVDYAKSFGVPFEYKCIASKWEEVRVEDLDIDRDEFLVVNCLYQMRYLADETVLADSPRDMVLNTIRKMNPDVFVLGIVNGSYNAPFFVTRFREALFHFSALYDMLDTIVPREDEQRLLIEKEIFGRDALNVIACEGTDRVERPETYKQWQVRNLRAGFVQHPVNQDIMKRAREKVKAFYHKDFDVDEHNRWLLQGWKGRTLYALSSWKPTGVS